MTRVRFGPSHYHILKFDDDMDKELVWYNRQHFKKTFKQLQKERSIHRRNHRKSHVRSILSMQAQARKMGIQAQEVNTIGSQAVSSALKSFSSALSKADVKRAREKATNCALEAIQVYTQSSEWMGDIYAEDYIRANPPAVVKEDEKVRLMEDEKVRALKKALATEC